MRIPPGTYDYIETNPEVSTEELVHMGFARSRRSAQRYKQAMADGSAERGSEYQTYDTPPHETHKDTSSNRAYAWSKSTRITTIEQLVEFCEIDLSRWTIYRAVVNKWEVGVKQLNGTVQVEPLFQIKVWLEPVEASSAVDALEELIEELRQSGPVVKKPVYPRQDSDGYLTVVGMLDTHLGRRVSGNTYSLEDAAADFKLVGDTICSKILGFGRSVDRILFPVGNDAINADTLYGTTTNGTQVEMSADMRDVFRETLWAYIHVMTSLANIAPVDVVCVQSNHDRLIGSALGTSLEAYFSRDRRFTFNNKNTPRKYYMYGTTLLGFDHGDKVKPDKLAAIMAVEAPNEWAGSEHRHWMRGHIHYQAEMYIPLTTAYGVGVRVIPALCPLDDWHKLMGFIGNKRAGDVWYIHPKEGPAGEFPVFASDVD